MTKLITPPHGLPRSPALPGPISGAAPEVCPKIIGPGSISPSGDIIICDRRFAVNAPVINWKDDLRWSAYYPCGYRGDCGAAQGVYPFHPAKGMEQRRMRYRPRKELMGRHHDFATLKRLIRQCVIHHDGAENSAQCFHILHDERGLSAHFLVDNDGTVYQTLDLADVAFHAQSANGRSIGIEVCNRGLVHLPASALSSRGREPLPIAIHGYSYNAWTFTSAQYHSLGKLLAALFRLFPGLPCAYPNDGGPIRTMLAEPERFAGVLGHYHLSLRKWDPGNFDFALVLRAASRTSTGRGQPPALVSPPQAEPPALLLHHNAQAQPASGGYYPVGPCGRDLVWHGGVHLALPPQTPLVAPLPGSVVAARLDQPRGAVGSANFILVHHQPVVRGQTLSFFLLLYHLDALPRLTSPLPAGAPAWLRQAAARAPVSWQPRGVWFPAAAVLTGDLLGQVGTAGPAGAVEGQIHVEIMAATEITEAVAPGAFQLRDCSKNGLVCLEPDLQKLLGRHHLPDLWQAMARDSGLAARLAPLRQLAVYAPSEWTVQSGAAWERQLADSNSFQKLPAAARQQLYCEQIAPYAWLSPELANRVGLPASGKVWHYHPLAFLSWLAAELPQSAATGSAKVAAVATRHAAAQPAEDGALGDDGYVSEEDLSDFELGEQELNFEDIARGYPPQWLDSGH